MDRLSSKDLSKLSKAIFVCYSSKSLGDLVAKSSKAMKGVMDFDILSYNEMNIRNFGTGRSISSPVELPIPKYSDAFKKYFHEDKMLLHIFSTGDGQALKPTDFVSTAAWRKTNIYNEFYLPLGPKYRISFADVDFKTGGVLGMSLCRMGADFAERDRLILNLTKMHFKSICRNAAFFGKISGDGAPDETENGDDKPGLISAGPEGKIKWMTPKAVSMLETYFGKAFTSRAGKLPREIVNHVKSTANIKDNLNKDISKSISPFAKTSGRGALVIRTLISPADDLILLALHEDPEETGFSRIRDFLLGKGLTGREAEVLAWVSYGKTSAEIAAILDISPRTVHKFLEKIYCKLGVENRVGAVAFIYGRGKNSMSG